MGTMPLPKGITRINKATCHHFSWYLTCGRCFIIVNISQECSQEQTYLTHAGPWLFCLILSCCCLLNGQLLPNGARSERWLFPIFKFITLQSPQLDRWTKANLRPQTYHPSLTDNCVNCFDAKVNYVLFVGAMVMRHILESMVDVSGFRHSTSNWSPRATRWMQEMRKE